MDRRRALRWLAASGGAVLARLGGRTASATALLASAASPGGAAAEPGAGKKLVIVQFGGGARSSETIDDPAHRHVPRLWGKLIPQGTLFSNMRVEPPVVHPCSTASMVTGHWEFADLDWSRPPRHATLFERYRQSRGADDTAVWAFVYAAILAQIGESRDERFGRGYAANVVVPPTIPRTTAEQMDQWMAEAVASGSREAEEAAALRSAELVRQMSRFSLGGLRSQVALTWTRAQIERWRQDRTATTSHDAFLAETAVACMRRFAPEVLVICFGEIDCAHYGSWSRYVEAIERTDELTWWLWQACEQHQAYRGRTLFLVLPDHGRELERPGGPGYIHHSDFYPVAYEYLPHFHVRNSVGAEIIEESREATVVSTRAPAGSLYLRFSPGGLTDLEFIAAWGQLRYGQSNLALHTTNPFQALRRMVERGDLDARLLDHYHFLAWVWG